MNAVRFWDIHSVAVSSVINGVSYDHALSSLHLHLRTCGRLQFDGATLSPSSKMVNEFGVPSTPVLIATGRDTIQFNANSHRRIPSDTQRSFYHTCGHFFATLLLMPIRYFVGILWVAPTGVVLVFGLAAAVALPFELLLLVLRLWALESLVSDLTTVIALAGERAKAYFVVIRINVCTVGSGSTSLSHLLARSSKNAFSSIRRQAGKEVRNDGASVRTTKRSRAFFVSCAFSLFPPIKSLLTFLVHTDVQTSANQPALKKSRTHDICSSQSNHVKIFWYTDRLDVCQSQSILLEGIRN